MAERFKTKNKEEIKTWVEERGGKPARVMGTEDQLRIKFAEVETEEELEEISWDDFNSAFEKYGLNFEADTVPESKEYEIKKSHLP